jgi:hypothetical protein
MTAGTLKQLLARFPDQMDVYMEIGCELGEPTDLKATTFEGVEHLTLEGNSYYA